MRFPAAQRYVPQTVERGALALRAALLPPPEGWTLSKPTHSRAPKSVCPDFKNSAQTIDADAYYSMRPSLENLRRAQVARDAMNA